MTKVINDVRERLGILKQDNLVQEGLSFLEKDDGYTLSEQIHMTEIPAPPYHEYERGEYVREQFEAHHLKDVHRDDEGNIIGIRKGQEEGPTLVVSAHLDTVFPVGTITKVKKKNGKFYAPGIFDDTRGVAELLSVLRALQKTGLDTKGTIYFVATVGEEGLGNLRGVKSFFKENKNIDGFISIDGTSVENVVYEATGSRRYQITYSATGGHSYGDFGMPSATHAAGRAIAKIADYKPPKDPKTTYTVGEIQGGTAINAIASSAKILLDMRSVSPNALEELEGILLGACKEAAHEENHHWDKEDVKVEFELLGSRPAGIQDKESTIVQTMIGVSEQLGITANLRGAGSTDANIPISLGIPAVTIGRGGNGGGTHTLDEWFEPDNAYLSPQRTFLMILALIGVKDGSAKALL